MNGSEKKNKSERIHFNRPFTTMIIYCPLHWFSSEGADGINVIRFCLAAN